MKELWIVKIPFRVENLWQRAYYSGKEELLLDANGMGILSAKGVLYFDGVFYQGGKLKIYFEEGGIFLVQVHFQIKRCKLVISPERMRFIGRGQYYPFIIHAFIPR